MIVARPALSRAVERQSEACAAKSSLRSTHLSAGLLIWPLVFGFAAEEIKNQDAPRVDSDNRQRFRCSAWNLETMCPRRYINDIFMRFSRWLHNRLESGNPHSLNPSAGGLPRLIPRYHDYKDEELF